MPETPTSGTPLPEVPIPGLIFPQAPPVEPPTLPPRPPRLTVSARLPRVAPVKVVVAVLIAGIAGAALLPTAVIGIGIALTGMVVLGAVFVGSPDRPSAWQLFTVAGILGLLVVAGWRSAEWVAGWCIVLALVSTGILLLDGRSIRDMAFTVIAPITLSPDTAGWLYRAAATNYADKPIKNPGAVIKVGGITVVLVVVFGGLFAGADATFASLLGDVTPDLDEPDVGWSVALGLVVAIFTALGCYIRYARPQLSHRVPRAAGDTWSWAIPTGTVLVLYVAFLITQARAMFGGNRYVQRTTHLTYADYARSGFWQLFAVTALTILVVSVAWQRADRATPARQWLVRGILGGLCISALVVVASAVHRMYLYIDAYGATRLRISVMAVELWFGAIVVALLIAGAGVGTRQLARTVGGMTILAALSFAIYNPDARIAQINVDRYLGSTTRDVPPTIDVDYLSGLSPDATSQLLRLPSTLRPCVLRDIADIVRADHGWTEFNVGRDLARRELRTVSIPAADASSACPTS